jgi:hypothetical protein
LPDVSAELNSVQTTISETLYATKVTADADSTIQVGTKTEAGEEILKEVSTFLQQKVEETLPEPPAMVPAADLMAASKAEVKQKAPPMREMVALSATNSSISSRSSQKTFEPVPLGGFASPPASKTSTVTIKKQEIKEITMTVQKPSIEDLLLEYVRKSNGEIDLTRCSTELNTSNSEIEKALESLGNKGRIKLELKSPE